MNNKDIIYKIIKLSQKSIKNADFPVGAIIMYKGKIVSKGYNKRNKTNYTTDHAEVIAINKANKKMKSWRLNDCEMFVTLEPCEMCKNIIKESRIKKTYYLFDKNPEKKQYSKSVFKKITIKDDDKVKQCLNQIESFFLDKR